MDFTVEKSIEILASTPDTLRAMLHGISPEWTSANEGDGTWSAYDVMGHLIHGEYTDWIPRMEIILSDKPVRNFEPFNRFAQFKESAGKSLIQLLDEFNLIRRKNIAVLHDKALTNSDLSRTGTHPAFGQVTLRQLLATWVVHDLNHISQIARILANQYKAEIGPWTAYLRILQS